MDVDAQQVVQSLNITGGGQVKVVVVADPPRAVTLVLRKVGDAAGRGNVAELAGL
ncbi:hypothetical protein ANO11243_067310 [Dothideomycetidae sp. 11243]|nr:hypothetical protein ANO11243_067310 [fungal sp. No.11243]